MAKTKFKIEYTIDKIELYLRTEETLLSEGWEKTNYTTFDLKGMINTDEIYTSWFEREWQ